MFLFEFVFVYKYKRTDASQHLCRTQFYKNKFGDANIAMSIMTSILLGIIILLIFLSLMVNHFCYVIIRMLKLISYILFIVVYFFY